jgi:hypothetical protein
MIYLQIDFAISYKDQDILKISKIIEKVNLLFYIFFYFKLIRILIYLHVV